MSTNDFKVTVNNTNERNNEVKVTKENNKEGNNVTTQYNFPFHHPYEIEKIFLFSKIIDLDLMVIKTTILNHYSYI